MQKKISGVSHKALWEEFKQYIDDNFENINQAAQALGENSGNLYTSYSQGRPIRPMMRILGYKKVTIYAKERK